MKQYQSLVASWNILKSPLRCEPISKDSFVSCVSSFAFLNVYSFQRQRSHSETWFVWSREGLSVSASIEHCLVTCGSGLIIRIVAKTMNSNSVYSPTEFKPFWCSSNQKRIISKSWSEPPTQPRLGQIMLYRFWLAVERYNRNRNFRRNSRFNTQVARPQTRASHDTNSDVSKNLKTSTRWEL